MTPAVEVAVGAQLGPYVIVDTLGEGGMGVVYRAKHTLLNRPAAIKVLRPELGSHPQVLDRFLNEARATTAIRHPGIVEVYDYGHTANGCAYIAMELLVGETLGERLKARGKFSLADALMIARRIAAPLAVAHEAGIVHRDLKPDNVFLIRDPDGGAHDQVKLLDFGIAKLESAVNKTTIGVVLGTPAYMAPEQCMALPDADHRVDLYALGCIMHELVTGAPPFGSTGGMTEVMSAHVHAPVPAISGIDHQIARLITRLLAKSPADRPRSAVEVVFEIDRYLAVEPPPTPGPRHTMRLALATATGLALTLASIGAWVKSRRAPKRMELPSPPSVIANGSQVFPLDAGTKPPLPDAGVAIAPTVLDAAPITTKVIKKTTHDRAGSAAVVNVNTTVTDDAGSDVDRNTTVSD
ncbi:MAG: serine/threonine-protein kinase [Kofleriaceae bacterium]